MKISMLVHKFLPSIGGTQLLVYNISKRLVERGHVVNVYTSQTPGAKFSEVRDGIVVKRFAVRSPVSFPQRITPAMSRLLFTGMKSDIVHSFGLFTFQSVIAAMIKVTWRTPMVLHPQLHSPSLIDVNSNHAKMVSNLVFSSADRVIAQCEAEMNSITKYVSRNKTRMVPPGIDAMTYQSHFDQKIFKKRYGISSDDKVVLYVGHLSRYKRVSDLIAQMPMILEAVGNVKLVIIGGGGTEEELISLDKKLGLNSGILLLSKLSEEELAEAYATADVVVFTSSSESFGMVLIEAAASGKPIVSSRIGVAPEIIEDGVNGVLLDINSLTGLAEAVIQTLSDDHFCEEAQKRKAEILKTFDWNHIVDDLERVYEELAD